MEALERKQSDAVKSGNRFEKLEIRWTENFGDEIFIRRGELWDPLPNSPGCTVCEPETPKPIMFHALDFRSSRVAFSVLCASCIARA